jgi:hypothetical protein
MLVNLMANLSILLPFGVCILWSFGICCGHLVYVVVIWYMLWPFGICCGHFGMFLQVWSVVSKKSGNPVLEDPENTNKTEGTSATRLLEFSTFGQFFKETFYQSPTLGLNFDNLLNFGENTIILKVKIGLLLLPVLD